MRVNGFVTLVARNDNSQKNSVTVHLSGFRPLFSFTPMEGRYAARGQGWPERRMSMEGRYVTGAGMRRSGAWKDWQKIAPCIFCTPAVHGGRMVREARDDVQDVQVLRKARDKVRPKVERVAWAMAVSDWPERCLSSKGWSLFPPH